jgi:hypothetical protein
VVVVRVVPVWVEQVVVVAAAAVVAVRVLGKA